jgi:hypothetical protein
VKLRPRLLKVKLCPHPLKVKLRLRFLPKPKLRRERYWKKPPPVRGMKLERFAK